MSPSVIPAVGPLISSLVSSGVSRYGSFKLLGPVAIFDGVRVKPVPQSKEDIFRDKNLSHIDKRRLMRFLMFAAGEFEQSKELIDNTDIPFLDFLTSTFSLTEEIARTITFAMAYCSSQSEPTLPALHRVRNCLRSTGRYGPSAFLVGYYGGSGEIAQGFCRTSAVNGGVYILGRNVLAINRTDGNSETSRQSRYTIEVEGIPESLISQCLISSPHHVPEHLCSLAASTSTLGPTTGILQAVAVARCIAIVERPILLNSPPPGTSHGDEGPTVAEAPEPDTSILVFPPGSLPHGSTTSSVHVLTTGPGTMSAPAGKWIIYITMPLFELTATSPESLLKPYLDFVLSLADSSGLETRPLFLTHYIQHLRPSRGSPAPEDDNPCSILITPSLCPHTTQSPDEAALVAEAIFWKAVSFLKSVRGGLQLSGAESSAEDIAIEGFWPPAGVTDEESDDGW
ncbi:FAD/NAD(P)-binding domain-containing protein [Leucogyrophana mollusca]|uniref:FAD/NAD(P)-binding domain-containing protein n=1 Tax=Leucogyrophana mollusca TaxID=85980 RepID=A0ACB8BHU6_9AGAM|nr:FAD/NAD(P)-binding domain-containing protein [Leucogyrophana mollusca]